MHQPFPKRQILDSSKLKEFADDNLKFDKHGLKLSKSLENPVGKGEIACYVFNRGLFWERVKPTIAGAWFILKTGKILCEGRWPSIVVLVPGVFMDSQNMTKHGVV